MKPISHIFSHVAVLAGIALSALCLLATGCTSTWEDACPPDADGNPRIVLHLSVPGQTATHTRAMAATTESSISGLPYVLVFKQGASGVEDTYAYTAKVTAGTTTGSYIATLNPSEEYHKLMLIANTGTALPALTAGSTMSVVKNLLTFDASDTWGTAKHLPLWGETDYQTITDATAFHDANNATSPSSAIRMIRALARVDIGLAYNVDYSSASGITGYSLTSIAVYNSKKSGYATGTTITNWPTGITANVPAGAESQKLTYTPSTNLFAAEIYIPEAVAGNSWEDEAATGLVVGLTKDGTTLYHRVDFRDYKLETMLPVLRNHHYRINIKSVNTSGFSTPDEAWKAKRVTLGLEVKAWEFSSQNATLPGANYLAVDKKEITIEGEAFTNLAAFNIDTNIMGTDNKPNWNVSTTDTWLTAQRDATDGKKLLITPSMNTTAARTGTITIKSPDNRLTLKVKVTQRPKIMDPTVADGANCYILTPTSSNPTTGNLEIAAYKGGQGSTGTLNDIEAVTIWRQPRQGNLGFISGYTPTFDPSTGKVGFRLATDFEGNILIGIRKRGTTDIIWSWHIWVVNSPIEQQQIETGSAGNRNFMDRNLGAFDETDYSNDAYGCLYQWGRKDPMPGASTTSGVRQGTIRNSADVATTDWSILTPTVEQATIAYASAHPDRFIRAGSSNSWLGTQQDNLWGSNTVTGKTVKSKYDPCPKGWRVPTYGSTEGWPSGITPTSSDYYKMTFASYGGNYSKAYYLGVTGALPSVYYGSQPGYYWTASPSGTDNGYSLYLPASGTVDSNKSIPRAYACSVRCVKDSQ